MSSAPRPVSSRGRRRVFMALSIGLVLASGLAATAVVTLDNPLRGVLGDENEATVVEPSVAELVPLEEVGLDTFHNEHATFQTLAGWEAQERPEEDAFGDSVESDRYTLDFVGPGDNGYTVTFVRTERFEGEPLASLDVLTSVEGTRAEENETYDTVTLEEVSGAAFGGTDAAYSEGVYEPNELERLVEGSPTGELMRRQVTASDGERLYSLILIGPRDQLEDSEAASTMIDSFELQN